MASPIFSMRTLGTVRQSRFFSGTARRCAANVKSLGVVGAGQMGLGIALVAAQKAQLPVTLIDTSDKALDKGLAFA
ncbi:hypothetical protein E4U54_002904, partial [Claviceps lovelessii]